MVDSPSKPRIAMFIDAENVIFSALNAGVSVSAAGLVDLIKERGAISFARAYGDWTCSSLKKHMFFFHSSVIELTQLISHPQNTGKNTADIQIVVDAMEMALLPSSPDSFVIVAGDRDFVPLVQKLKRYGKTVVGVGIRGSTSQYLDAICDEFLYYGENVGQAVESTTATPEGEKAKQQSMPKVDAEQPVADAVKEGRIKSVSTDDGDSLVGSHKKLGKDEKEEQEKPQCCEKRQKSQAENSEEELQSMPKVDAEQPVADAVKEGYVTSLPPGHRDSLLEVLKTPEEMREVEQGSRDDKEAEQYNTPETTPSKGRGEQQENISTVDPQEKWLAKIKELQNTGRSMTFAEVIELFELVSKLERHYADGDRGKLTSHNTVFSSALSEHMTHSRQGYRQTRDSYYAAKGIAANGEGVYAILERAGRDMSASLGKGESLRSLLHESDVAVLNEIAAKADEYEAYHAKRLLGLSEMTKEDHREKENQANAQYRDLIKNEELDLGAIESALLGAWELEPRLDSANRLEQKLRNLNDIGIPRSYEESMVEPCDFKRLGSHGFGKNVTGLLRSSSRHRLMVIIGLWHRAKSGDLDDVTMCQLKQMTVLDGNPRLREYSAEVLELAEQKARAE